MYKGINLGHESKQYPNFYFHWHPTADAQPTLRLAANSKWCSLANKQSRTKFNGAGMQCKSWKYHVCKNLSWEESGELQID